MIVPSTSPSSPAAGIVRRHAGWLAGGLFTTLALVLYAPLLGRLPEGIHSWAQADRLALAFGFYDYGLDFFRPRTLNLASIGGVTGVEFPLQAWLAALGGKLLGRSAIPAIFRLLTAAAAVAAATALARLVYARTGHLMAALVPGGFYFTAPVVSYYAGNFLPDTFSASLVLVGYCAFSSYYETAAAERSFRVLLLALSLLTVATLVKTSAGTWLAAAFVFTGGWSYLQPVSLTYRQRLAFLATAGMAGVAIGGYIFFNRWLNSTFQSTLFLAAANPIETAAQWAFVWERIRQVWWLEYFTRQHYQVLIACLLLVVPYASQIWRRHWALASQLLLGAAGVAGFVKLLGLQLIDHDYYVIAPLVPLAVLLLTLTVLNLESTAAARHLPAWSRHLAWGAVLLLVLWPGLRHYRARIGESYPPFSHYYDHQWLRGGANLLARAGVPAQATILVVGQRPPNTALVYFNRRGLTWGGRPDEFATAPLLPLMKNYNLGYLIARRPDWQALVALHPTLRTALRPVVDTDSVPLVILARNPAVKTSW